MPEPPKLGRNVLMASCVINLLSLGLPLVIVQVYDRVLPNHATNTLVFLVLGLIGVLIVDGVLRVVRSNVMSWQSAEFEHIITCRAVDRILATDIRSFKADDPGVHLDRLQALETLRDFYAGQAKLLIVDLPFIVLFLGLIWAIGGWLALVPVALFTLFGLSILALSKFIRVALEERAQSDDRRYSFMIEVLAGIHTIKGMAMESFMERRNEQLQERAAACTYTVTFLTGAAQSIGALFSQLTIVAVAAIGAVLAVSGSLSVGSLAACTLLSGRSIQPLMRALGLSAQLQAIRIARRRLDTLFAMMPEAPKKARIAEPLQGDIELADVKFSYSDDGPPILDGIDLKIPAGELVGITGGSGSGKSTLLSMIMGTLKPISGEVRIDGIPVSQFEPVSLRRQIAYLPKSPVLFEGTILENLTMFRGPESIDNALDAAQLLGLDRLVNRLPSGYNTKISGGVQDELPAGIRQSIAISRSLVGRPPLVLFHESNDALDFESNTLLMEAFARLKGQSTIILVSHRPSTLAMADRTFELQNGKLIERPRMQSAPGHARAAPNTRTEPQPLMRIPVVKRAVS